MYVSTLWQISTISNGGEQKRKVGTETTSRPTNRVIGRDPIMCVWIRNLWAMTHSFIGRPRLGSHHDDTTTNTAMMMRRSGHRSLLLLYASVLATVSLLLRGGHVVVVVDAAPTEDLIVDLPLVGKTSTPQYSGYLDATGALLQIFVSLIYICWFPRFPLTIQSQYVLHLLVPAFL
jgi:hypothetical protein